MKSIIKYFAVALLLMVMSGCNKLPDGAIATEDNGKIIFTDTTALKQTVMFDLRGKFANFHIDKTRIRQITTIGERSEKIFVLQLSDVKNQVRIVRYVFRKDNEFYLYESLSEAQQKMYGDNLFYQVYFACSGSDSRECEPNSAFIDNQLKWGCGTNMVCNLASACKGSEILVVR